MINSFRSWTSLTLIIAPGGSRDPFDREIAAVGTRIPKRHRASLLSTVAFRLWAAASMCLAAHGATAAGSATLLPQICATADLRITMLIEAHGEAQDVAAETLAHAFLTVLDARKACNEGQIDAAMKLYESIPLGAGMSRGK
jgi:hypothetical protein